MILDNRTIIKFLVYTFFLTYLSWGIIIAAGRVGLFGVDSLPGTILYIGGTWAPTIFSYIF